MDSETVGCLARTGEAADENPFEIAQEISYTIPLTKHTESQEEDASHCKKQ